MRNDMKVKTKLGQHQQYSTVTMTIIMTRIMRLETTATIVVLVNEIVEVLQ